MARQKRKDTGDSRWYAPLETQNVKFSNWMQNIVAKPFIILFSEPMLIVGKSFNGVIIYFLSVPQFH
jgi:hypothetical protein